MHPHTVLVTVTGFDRPGVISALFPALAAHDVEVLDVEQLVIRGRLVLGVALALHGDPGALRRAATLAAEALGTEIEVTSSEDLTEPAVPRRSRHHVVVLGRPLRAGAVGEIARRIADLGGNVESISRVGEDGFIGLELMVTGADHHRLATTLVTVAVETGTDIAMERATLRRRSKRMVLFDADRTLLPTDTLGLLAELAGRGAESARLVAAAREAELLAGAAGRLADDIAPRLSTYPGPDGHTASARASRPGSSWPGPSRSDPSWSGPAGAGPDGREPGGREPGGREPAGAAPDGWEPGGREPGGREPAGAGPDGREPAGAGPDGRESGGREPERRGADGHGPDGRGAVVPRRDGYGPAGHRPAGAGPGRGGADRRPASDPLAAVVAQTAAAQREAELLRARVALLAGLPATALAQVRAEVRWAPGADALLARLRRMGYRCGAVSGGAAQVVEPLLDRLGLDFAVANRLEVAGRRLTGRLVDTGLHPAGKVQALIQFAEAHGVPLSQTVAVGGLGGVDMVACAGLGLAVGAGAGGGWPAAPAPRGSGTDHRSAQHRSAGHNGDGGPGDVSYAEALLVMLGLPTDGPDGTGKSAAVPMPAATPRTGH
jgi:phosphoserine phosphatase/predicted amino acid-binding ACT domain protein